MSGLDPYLKKDIDSLESVQKFAMRVCSKQWDADYPTLLSSLNLPTLAARRKRMKLCIMYKIVNGLVDFPNAPVAPRDNPFELRNIHAHTLTRLPVKTNSFMYSFFPSVLNDWNSLPPEVASASYNSFNTFLLSMY